MLVELGVKNLPANAGDERCGFDLWVRKVPWIRKWQPTPVFLPGKSFGQRSLAGSSPWGRKEPDTTEHAHRVFSDSPLLRAGQGACVSLVHRWCSERIMWFSFVLHEQAGITSSRAVASVFTDCPPRLVLSPGNSHGNLRKFHVIIPKK